MRYKQQFLIAHFIVFRFANIIVLSGGVFMKNKNYHLYLTDTEYTNIISALINLKNNLISQGRYTDAVDDVILKLASSKKQSIKIKYS